VSIFDVGEVEAVPFIAMELLEGTTLRSYVGNPDVPLDDRLRWLVEVAQVLQAAHEAGLVHRDIKPENIFVCGSGVTKVLDFGIAKSTEVHAPRSTRMAAPDSGPLSFRTTEGRLRGTPRYMAPERFQGAKLDGRSDQYSWGLVAYELLAGAHPARFEAEEQWPLESPPRPLGKVDTAIRPGVSECVMRTLHVDPTKRYDSMEQIVVALEPYVVPLLRGRKALSGGRGVVSPSIGLLTTRRDPLVQPARMDWRRSRIAAGIFSLG
jgi:eukaryotic-like serine/threonine-protein kinase